MDVMRVSRFLAQAGIASRRKCEEFVAAGRVQVNGVVAALSTNVDPGNDVIVFDGSRVRLEKKVYVLLNKPKGVIVSVGDERGRRTVMDIVKVRERLFPVGRLDKDTEGVLLLTNDGDFAQRILHPRNELEKEYEVVLNLPMDDVRRKKLERGLPIDGRPVKLRFVRSAEKKFRIVIHEGRKHIVKRLFERLGFKVRKLVRVRVGRITTAGLERGSWRPLTKEEIASFK